MVIQKGRSGVPFLIPSPAITHPSPNQTAAYNVIPGDGADLVVRHPVLQSKKPLGEKYPGCLIASQNTYLEPTQASV